MEFNPGFVSLGPVRPGIEGEREFQAPFAVSIYWFCVGQDRFSSLDPVREAAWDTSVPSGDISPKTPAKQGSRPPFGDR